MDFRKHWDRWLWMVPAAFILLAAARLSFGREPFCSAGTDEHCLREWISALGGWAAVAAAVPTVLFLSKQVSDAERFARITIRMNTLPAIEHAKHVSALAGLLKKCVRESVERLTQIPSADETEDIKALLVRIGVVLRFLDRAELHEASREFQTLHRAKVLVDLLDEDNTQIQKLMESSSDTLMAGRDAVLRTMEIIEMFSNELTQKADQRALMAEEVLKQA